MSGEEAEVAEANARFYRAFETLDLTAMAAVWLHAEHVRCVHPGWPMLTGWDAVRASWDTIFRNTTEMQFTISDLVVTVRGDLGWVTCTENILGQVGDRVSVTSVLGTNLFRAVGRRMADGPPPRLARLRRGRSGVTIVRGRGPAFAV